MTYFSFVKHKKEIKQYLLLIIFVGCCFSCAKDAKKEESETTVEKIEGETPSDIVATPKLDLNKTEETVDVIFEDEELQKLYTHYLRIKAALVNSDEALVMKTASQMREDIQQNEENKDISATVQLISLTKDIKKQRDFFKTITDQMMAKVTTSKISEGEIYKQFCPMAFDGEGGYWLSNSSEVRNPYYGDKMLKCGEVKEVIK